MKSKLKALLGIGLTLVLLAALTVGLAAPAAADPGTLKFSNLVLPKVDADGDYWAYPDSDVGAIDVAADGETLFAAVEDDETGWQVMKSTDGGYAWKMLKDFRVTADVDTSPIVDVVVSPDYEEDITVFVATQNFLYQSVDGGKRFVQMTTDWADTETITDLDISLDERGRLAYMVGTSSMVPVTLVTKGAGTAEWSTEEAYSRIYSAKLTIPEGATWADAARVQVTYGELLSTVTNANIKYWYSYDGTPHNSFVRLDIDADGNGIRDHGLISQKQDAAVYDGTWTQTLQSDWWELYTCVEATQECTSVGWDTFANQKAAIGSPGTAELMYLLVMMGPTLVPQIATESMYIDDITIGDVTYDLEDDPDPLADPLVGVAYPGLGDVYVLSTATGMSWQEQGVGADVLAVGFSPFFADDEGIAAVVTDSVATEVRFSFANTAEGGGWGDDIGDAGIHDAEGGNFPSSHARIAFPDDFDPWGVGNNICFVGIYAGSETVPDDMMGDVYKVKLGGTSSAQDLDIRGVLTTLLPTQTNIVSIDVCGEAEEANILVGTDYCDLGAPGYYFLTYRSDDGGETWIPSGATKSPTGGTDIYGGAVFEDAWTQVLMSPDFLTDEIAYAATCGFDTSALSRSKDSGATWDQIGLIDYGDVEGGYVIKDLDAAGYNADGTLHMTTMVCADSFSLTATADGATATVKETDGKVSVSVLIETGTKGDVDIDYDDSEWTITFPDDGDAVLVTALEKATVTWTETEPTVSAAEVTDPHNDMTVEDSGKAFDMPDASTYGAVWKRTGSENWERIWSYANPGTTNNIKELIINGDETMFAVDYAAEKMWRSSNMGATWPKTINTKPNPTAVTVVSPTTIYTGHADGGIYWSTKSGTGWTKPDDSEIPSTTVVANIGVEGDVVLVGTTGGKVFISSDGGETVERVGITNPGDTTALATYDLGFADNNIIYAAVLKEDGGIWRTEVDFDDPGSSDWLRIDALQSSDPYDYNKVIPAGPALSLPPNGILYVVNAEAVAKADKAGGLWRCANPTDPAPYPYFEKENKGLDAGDSVGYKTVDLFPFVQFCSVSNEEEAVSYYNQIVMFTDTLDSGVPLAAPADGAAGVGTLYTGEHEVDVVLVWEKMEGATKYQWQVAIDKDFDSVVGGGFADGNVAPYTASPDTTYYWRVRVANETTVDAVPECLVGAPLISPWSEKWSFKTAIGPTVARPALEAPDAGEVDVLLSPTFEWSGIAWAEKYEFELGLDPATKAGGYFADVLVGLTGTNALVSTAWKCDIALDYEARYYWHVKAFGVDTETPWSDVGTFTTMAKPVLPPEPTAPVEIPPVEEITPAWIWAIIGIGAVLVIAVVVLIVTTRRVP